MKLSKRQAEYILRIHALFLAEDQMPTCEVLAEAVGSTPNAASEMIRRLARKGVLDHNRYGKYRRGRYWVSALVDAQRSSA